VSTTVLCPPFAGLYGAECAITLGDKTPGNEKAVTGSEEPLKGILAIYPACEQVLAHWLDTTDLPVIKQYDKVRNRAHAVLLTANS
jgi:hypothetical protein